MAGFNMEEPYFVPRTSIPVDHTIEYYIKKYFLTMIDIVEKLIAIEVIKKFAVKSSFLTLYLS